MAHDKYTIFYFDEKYQTSVWTQTQGLQYPVAGTLTTEPIRFIYIVTHILYLDPKSHIILVFIWMQDIVLGSTNGSMGEIWVIYGMIYTHA